MTTEIEQKQQTGRTGFALRTRTKVAVTTAVLGILAFLFGPVAPLGELIWPAPAIDVTPTSTQLAFLLLYDAIAALAFGFGIAYLVFGWRYVREVFGHVRRNLAILVHVCIFWIIWQEWVHYHLHTIVGMDLTGLILIEYGFHATVLLAGALVAFGFFTLATDDLGVTGTTE